MLAQAPQGVFPGRLQTVGRENTFLGRYDADRRPLGGGAGPPDLAWWAAGNSSSAELGYANYRSTIAGLELARITEKAKIVSLDFSSKSHRADRRHGVPLSIQPMHPDE